MSWSSFAIAVLAVILQVVGVILAEDDAVGEVNPCNDFFSYACKVRNITDSSKRLQMKDLMENYPSKIQELSDGEKIFYEFRKQCSQTNLEDKKNFFKKFNPSSGGWPAFNESWRADKFNLQIALAKLHSFNFPSVFQIKLKNEPHGFNNQIHVKLAIWGLLYDDDLTMVTKRTLSNIIDDVDEVISDGRLVEALYVAERNFTYEDVLTDYKGLKQEIPEIDWDEQFEVIYGQRVPDTFPVKIHKLGLLKRIIPKLFKIDPKVMANYLFYRIAFFLPELDEDVSTELLENVVYRMIIKQHYTAEIKEDLRGMLVSFLKTFANTMNLFGDEDKQNMEGTINDFVIDEILPDVDDSYYDNLYGKIRVSEDDCYSVALQLVNTSLKLEGDVYFKRKVDPFYSMRPLLMRTLMYKLHSFLDESSAVQFEVLTWIILDNYFLNYWDLERFNPIRQCLEKQIGEEFDDHYVKQVLRYQIFSKAYFNWTKDKANLMQLEETKYNDNSKKVLLERLIAHNCDSGPGKEKIKISGIFANLEAVSEVYNCPIGSRFNPESKCEIW